MQVVGRYLQVEAMKSHSPEEKDLFGRSSYNRYYYATFNVTRDIVRKINPDWVSSKHAEYPDIFSKKIVHRLKKERYSAIKVGDQELVCALNKAISSANDISRLLREANSARKVADYDLTIKINFVNTNRFSLSSVEIASAHLWSSRANALGSQIVDAWRQIDVN